MFAVIYIENTYNSNIKIRKKYKYLKKGDHKIEFLIYELKTNKVFFLINLSIYRPYIIFKFIKFESEK